MQNAQVLAETRLNSGVKRPSQPVIVVKTVKKSILVDRIEQVLIDRALISVCNGMIRGKKVVPRTRVGFVPTILVTGSNEGIRAIQVSELLELSKQAGYARLQRLINAGYLRKADKCYYLTDNGWLVYNATMAVLKPALDELVRELVSRAREEVNKYKKGPQLSLTGFKYNQFLL